MKLSREMVTKSHKLPCWLMLYSTVTKVSYTPERQTMLARVMPLNPRTKTLKSMYADDALLPHTSTALQSIYGPPFGACRCAT